MSLFYSVIVYWPCCSSHFWRSSQQSLHVENRNSFSCKIKSSYSIVDHWWHCSSWVLEEKSPWWFLFSKNDKWRATINWQKWQQWWWGCLHNIMAAQGKWWQWHQSVMAVVWQKLVYGHFWMQAVVVQWRQCDSCFRSGRVGLAAENNKQQATINQWQLQHWGGPVATVLWQHSLKVAAMALLCCGNGSITLLWQWHYTAVTWELLCCGSSVALPW